MTTCISVFGKAGVRASSRSTSSHCRTTNIKTAHLSTNARRNNNRSHEETLRQRDLFLDILSTNATRRDAKQFLARLKDHDLHNNAPPKPVVEKPRCPNVNLGSLYAPPRAISESPQFTRDDTEPEMPAREELHVALVSLRDPASLAEQTLEGLAMTIAQLVKLDMNILLVLGHGARDLINGNVPGKDKIMSYASRIATILDRHCPHGARLVMDAFINNEPSDPDGKSSALPDLRPVSPRLLLDPLSQGIVTIVPCLSYSSAWKTEQISAASIMSALVDATKQQHADILAKFQVDRVIILEPFGGLPSKARNDDAHVFVNLEQEFDDIVAELHEMRLSNTEADVHLDNLATLNNILTELPHSTSALIVTPEEAASSSLSGDEDTGLGPATRKQRNTLIHNLLTNKPLVSSSLPTARFTKDLSSNQHEPVTKVPNATLVKKGMPIAIIPGIERGTQGWQPPTGPNSLDLETDSRVDLDRLVHLINDSFRRQLDVEAYLKRIRGRVAGLIIAGNYEGGAILTWETPSSQTGGEHPPVPYLDKFAVLQSSQGSAGVADIVFQAMVRTCFPDGVCWRSRSNNPVNKWYFERATGSWTLPDTQWTMFWTGNGIVEDQKRWADYVDVCKGIVPTWADGKVPD